PPNICSHWATRKSLVASGTHERHGCLLREEKRNGGTPGTDRHQTFRPSEPDPATSVIHATRTQRIEVRHPRRLLVTRYITWHLSHSFKPEVCLATVVPVLLKALVVMQPPPQLTSMILPSLRPFGETRPPDVAPSVCRVVD